MRAANAHARDRRAMSPTRGHRIATAVRFAVVAVVCVALGLGAFRVATAAQDDALPMPFGFGIAVVMSGSMSPALQVDDLVVVRPQDSYAVGDIVVYQSGQSLVTHRVVAIEGDALTTQGDANNAPDNPVNESAVQGAVVACVPFAGAVIGALKTPAALAVLLLAAFALLLLSFRSTRRKQDASLTELEEEVCRLRAETVGTVGMAAAGKAVGMVRTTKAVEAAKTSEPIGMGAAVEMAEAVGTVEAAVGRECVRPRSAANVKGRKARIQRETQVQRSHAPRAVHVALAVALLAVCMGAVGARFATEDTADDSARVASFAFTQKGESNVKFDLSSITEPGKSKTYTFTVSNTNGNAVSEVALRCLFTVELNGSMPLECTITKQNDQGAGGSDPVAPANPDNSTTPTNAADPAGTPSAPGTTDTPDAPGTADPANPPDPVLFVSLADESTGSSGGTDERVVGSKAAKQEAATFQAAERRTDKYKLTVCWPSDKNDAKYASRSAVAEVRLTVKAEQID